MFRFYIISNIEANPYSPKSYNPSLDSAEKDKVLEVSNFRNIFGIKDFGHKNLRFLVLFLCLPMFHALLPLTGASRWLEDSVILP